MPAEATEILQKSELQAQVVQALQSHLPPQSLLWTDEQTAPFECDGLTAYRQRPLVVALPETYEQVQDILRVCHRLNAARIHRLHLLDQGKNSVQLPERSFRLGLVDFDPGQLSNPPNLFQSE